METRSRLLTFRCNEKEERRCKRVAAHYNLGVAAMIRMLVKKEALAIKHAQSSP